uniref:Uncharacterized protein n=1 Tax=Apteryx owenii TaxID=8824 RepID=A0A8B9Q5H6_APTOW
MPLAQLAEPWPDMELVHLDTEVSGAPLEKVTVAAGVSGMKWRKAAELVTKRAGPCCLTPCPALRPCSAGVFHLEEVWQVQG